MPCLYLAPCLAEPVHRNGEVLYVETLSHLRIAEKHQSQKRGQFLERGDKLPVQAVQGL